jgi:hypothetical protein
MVKAALSYGNRNDRKIIQCLCMLTLMPMKSTEAVYGSLEKQKLEMRIDEAANGRMDWIRFRQFLI